MASKTKKYSNPSLPFDVVPDILLHLPVKTLSRLKLVSKSWLSLISSPSFKSAHRRRSEQNPLLFVATLETDGRLFRNHFHALDHKRGGGELLDRETTGSYAPRWSRVQGLVPSERLDLVCMYGSDDVYVRNPATREQITLPRESSGFCSIRDGPHVVAFAYLPSVGEYKVLRVFLLSSFTHSVSCEVFTLGSGRWRGKRGPPFSVHDENSAVVGEAVHFLPGLFMSRRAVGDLHDDSEAVIARFDLKREEWSKVPLPSMRHLPRGSRGEARDFRLAQLGGSLCMEHSGRASVDLWVLEGRDGRGWVKAYSIDRRCYPHQFRVVDVGKDGRALVKRSDGKLQVFNPAEERVEATVFSGEPDFEVSSYVESFMTLDDESFRSLKKQAI